MIVRWSGREAHALRQAMRLSIDDFARHAQVSPRSVARWAQRGPQIRLRWDVQRLLDRVLADAGPAVEARLASLLSPEEPPPPPSKLDDLVDALFAQPSEGRPRLIHLERALARVHMDMQSCRYAQVLADLPGLIRRIGAASPPQRRAELSAQAHCVASDLLLRLDDVPMAMLAAQRAEAFTAGGQPLAAAQRAEAFTAAKQPLAFTAAEQPLAFTAAEQPLAFTAGEQPLAAAQRAEAFTAGEQPLAVAAAARSMVRVLTRCGRPAQAAALAHSTADRLAASTSLDGPRPRSAYGALLLGGAVAHAACGRRTEAMTMLGEASGLATRLDEDANYGWTAFAPANVTLHRMSALLSLGDPGMALHIAKQLDPQRIRLPERRAAWHLDTARACHTLGRHAEADAALRDAGHLSPGETHAVAVELGLR